MSKYNIVIFDSNGNAKTKSAKLKKTAIAIAFRYLKLGHDVMIEDNETGDTYEAQLESGEALWN